MDAPEPGGLGGTFGGNPLSCAAALAVLDEVATPHFRARADEIAAAIGSRLERYGVRGLGAMLAVELRSGDAAKRVTAAARERGLLVLACGLDGNVIRLLPPLTISDEDLASGLDILEETLGDAGASAA
jgi:4-aminobutyrate aminotransferase-like enzyme